MGPAEPVEDKRLEEAKGKFRPGIRLVRLADLSISYSPRQTRVDQDHVAALLEVIDRLPPILVDEVTMTVIDGMHRVEAHRRAGRSEMKAVYFSGTETEALVIAIQANVKHGKPLSRAERQAAAGAVLRRCPDRSDRWVGEICGLSHSTVARLREAARAADRAEGADRGTRTGRDGRRRPVDPAPGQAAVLRALADEPVTSIRRAAETAGVAPSTARRVAAALRGGQVPSPADRPPFGPGPGASQVEAEKGGAEQSWPNDAENSSWWARTTIVPADLSAYLGNVPLGRIYEVVDECRRRAHTWAEMADELEARARGGPGRGAGLGAGPAWARD
jgi:ParB-like chromosome segregation protein Spo0J